MAEKEAAQYRSMLLFSFYNTLFVLTLLISLFNILI